MQKNKTQIVVISLFLMSLICFGHISAQNNLNTPYSGLGIGDVKTDILHPYNNSLGGLSQTLRNDNMLNPFNPASYTAIKMNSFVFDMGFSGEIARMKTNSVQGNTEGTANISHIYFGFPIIEKYKMSFGLMPYSNTNYISTNTAEDPVYGRIKRVYEGFGGINQIYWGHGVQIAKNLSVGANVNFLFGTVHNMSSSEFLDSAYTHFFNPCIDKSTSVADLSGSVGVQYQLPVKETHLFSFGLTYDIPAKFKASYSEFMYSYKSSSFDSSFYEESQRDIKLPQSINAGIAYEKINKWMVGVDVKYTNWDNHLFLGESPDNKTDNFYTALGGELKGNLSSIKYWNRISWRGGVHFENAKYVINNNNIDDIGFHLGASFPMRKSRSAFNISFMYGILGTTSNDLIKKDYMKIGVSFSAGDRWFVRRKYD